MTSSARTIFLTTAWLLAAAGAARAGDGGAAREMAERLRQAAQDGVWGLAPLGVALALLLALTLDRLWAYRRRRLFGPPRSDRPDRPQPLAFELDVIAHGAAPDREGLAKLVEKRSNLLSDVVRQVLRLADLTLLERIALAEQVQANELAALRRRNGYFDVLYSTATLIGLLGALLGLIDAFARQAHQAAGPANAVVSAAVAPALCATGGGVVLAIFARILGEYFKNVHDKRRHELARYVMPLVRQLRPAPIAAAPSDAMPAFEVNKNGHSVDRHSGAR